MGMRYDSFSGSKSGWIFAILLSVTAGIAYGAGPGQGRSQLYPVTSHEWASRLRQTGDILPLEQLLQGIQDKHQGRVLAAELEQEQGRYIYEVELLDRQGRLRKLHLDARSGELLKDTH